MSKAKRLLFSIALVAVMSACATTPSRPISDPSQRLSVLTPERCGGVFLQVNAIIGGRADVDRGPWQIRQSSDVDRFDTALFSRWQNYYSHAYTSMAGNDTFPHILNYDLLGDIYYYGCDAKPTSLAGRMWHGDRGPVEQNKQLAALHYEFAAIGHVGRSQYKLGRMLVEGDGIPEDKDIGIKWLISAAMEGNSAARSYLRTIGIDDVPAAVWPNTFQVLAENERQLQREFQQYLQERQAKKRENWATLAAVSLVALGAYYSAGSIAATPAVSQPSSSAPLRRTTVHRSKPVFCTSNLQMTGLQSGSMTFVNGTISTFCQ